MGWLKGLDRLLEVNGAAFLAAHRFVGNKTGQLCCREAVSHRTWRINPWVKVPARFKFGALKHRAGKKLGWLKGLEPSTTGITIRGSTN